MLSNIFYFDESVKLTSEEVKYWNRIVSSNLKIGVELECCYGPEHSQGRIQDGLRTILRPTDNYGEFGKCGVIAVKGDGSLDNGVEICTTGRRVSFLDYYEQYRFIVGKMMDYGPIMNSRAGLHNHMLLDYKREEYNCLEKPMPGIIFKNFIQLFRRYMPELAWITSTCKGENDEVTRMAKFCSQDSLCSINMRDNLSNIKRNINSGSGGDRYKFVNCNPLSVDTNGLVNRFHVELRFPDGSIYPAQIAAQNILYAAIFDKAVELSQHGLIATGTESEWQETKMLINKFRNDLGPNRTSRKCTTQELTLISERAIEFVKFIKPSLAKYDSHTYYILADLAKEPISIKRRTKTDQFINDYYNQIVNTMFLSSTDDCSEVSKVISTQRLKGLRSPAEWVETVSTDLNLSVDALNNQMFRLKSEKPYEWDRELGMYFFK